MYIHYRFGVVTCNPLCDEIGRTHIEGGPVVRYQFGQDDVRHEVGKSIIFFKEVFCLVYPPPCCYCDVASFWAHACAA